MEQVGNKPKRISKDKEQPVTKIVFNRETDHYFAFSPLLDNIPEELVDNGRCSLQIVARGQNGTFVSTRPNVSHSQENTQASGSYTSYNLWFPEKGAQEDAGVLYLPFNPSELSKLELKIEKTSS